MKQIFILYTYFLILASVIAPDTLFSAPSTPKLQTLYKSLDNRSIAHLLAFYELYPNTYEGKKAFQQAWRLLSGNLTQGGSDLVSLDFSHPAIKAIIALVNKQPMEDIVSLSENDLKVIDALASKLANRRLKGFTARSEKDVLALQPEDIDLARGLLISEMNGEIPNWEKLRTYEAMIDLMALQIRTSLREESTSEEKIAAINQFIFEDLGFRFPPHSCYAKNVDLYTFLPSVLDSRRGVCLGVSILYICLAQRLSLPLEMITPPGHIYVRYHDGNKEINIETTARGVHLDSETYLGINTRSLQQRNIKEVIGLSHFNQASVYWITGEYEKALKCYSEAKKYLPDDMLLKELMAYNHLLAGNLDEGKRLLEIVEGHIPDYAVANDPLPTEYLKGQVNPEGIRAIFMHVDENRESLLGKQKIIEDVLQRYPDFSTGWFHLATILLQLHRETEAFEHLKHYHQLNPNDPTAEYYLTVLYASRLDYPKAWDHLRQAEKLALARQHEPKVLKQLRKELSFRYPEYKNP